MAAGAVLDDVLNAARRLPTLLVTESALLSTAFKVTLLVPARECTACNAVLAVPLDTGKAVFARRGFLCMRCPNGAVVVEQGGTCTCAKH